MSESPRIKDTPSTDERPSDRGDARTAPIPKPRSSQELSPREEVHSRTPPEEAQTFPASRISALPKQGVPAQPKPLVQVRLAVLSSHQRQLRCRARDSRRPGNGLAANPTALARPSLVRDPVARPGVHVAFLQIGCGLAMHPAYNIAPTCSSRWVRATPVSRYGVWYIAGMWEVYEHRPIVRRLSRLPVEVLKRYEKGKDIVRVSGPVGIRQIKGFHDEARRGEETWHELHFRRS